MNDSQQSVRPEALPAVPAAQPRATWASTRDEDIARYQALPIEERIRIAASMVIRTGRERTDR